MTRPDALRRLAVWRNHAQETLAMNGCRCIGIQLLLAVAITAMAVPARAVEQGPGKGPWQFGVPEEHGLDSEQLKAVGDAIGRINGRQGLVIVRDGVIVYEDYWHDPDFHQATPAWRNVSFSAGKSWGSAVVGVAVTRGLIGVDDLVSRYHPPERSGLRPETTIRHVLTMSSGGTLVIKPSTRRPSRKTDNAPRGKGIDYLRVIKPVDDAPPGYGTTLKPGTVFYYDGEPVDHLANVIASAAGITSHEFSRTYLLEPLGVENFNYQPEGIDSEGNIRMAGSIEMSVRDFARLGQLWLNHGRWDGKQLIAAEYVAASITPSATNPDYGFLWWLHTTGKRQPGAPTTLFNASGAFGQLLYVLPEKNMVIATMGFSSERPPAGAIWNALAPIIVGDR
jgi:CubicO group peptidase (beta-lactamase class C family)